MRPASPALKNYLATLGSARPAIVADLLTWRLVDGSFVRISNFQTSLAPPANSFQPPDSFGKGASVNYAASSVPVSFPLGPPIGPMRWQVKIGTQPDETDITIYAGAGDRIGLYTWQESCLLGLFDGAMVEIDRLFMPSPNDYSLGSFVLYSGRVGDITVGRSSVIMKVPSLLVLLTNMMPRRLYGAPCSHVFGDAMCLFDRNSLAATFTATAGTTQNALLGMTTPTPADQYNSGTIVGITGANAGITRTVAKIEAGVTFLSLPYAFPVLAGNQFKLLPGCDHTVARCTALGNFIHYGGFPNIPPPEAFF